MTNDNRTSNVTITAYEQYLLTIWKTFNQFPTAATKTVPVALHVVGVLANTTLLIYLIHSRRCRLAVFALLTSLAMSDWLTSSFVCISILFMYPDLVFLLGAKQICRAITFIFMFAYCGSICHVMALAALRFYQLVSPLQAKAHVTTGRVVKCCCGMWLFCAAFATPYIIYYAVIPVPYNGKTLLIYLFVGNYAVKEAFLSIFVQGIPLVVIASLHLIKLFKVTKASEMSESARLSSSSLTVKLLITCFVMSILPRFLHTCYHSVLGYPYHSIHIEMELYTSMIIYTNSFVDPFLYLLSSKEIRRDIYEMVRRKAIEKT